MIFHIGTSHRYFVVLPYFGYRSHSTWKIVNGIATLFDDRKLGQEKDCNADPSLPHHNKKDKLQKEANTIPSNFETDSRNFKLVENFALPFLCNGIECQLRFNCVYFFL